MLQPRFHMFVPIIIGFGLVATAFLVTPRLSRAQTSSATGAATDATTQTAFAYQGRLSAGSGGAVDGVCAFRFSLYPSLTGGSALATVSLPVVPVHSGYFSAALDFGSGAFTGQPRFLEIQVDCDGAGYTTLSPRQQIHAAPYAVYASDAGNAQALQGHAVAAKAPAAGQTLKWDGARWSPAQDETGGITGVSAGPGLVGGGSSGTVTLAADFAGSGSAQKAARSDHTHDETGGITGVSAGSGLIGGGNSGTVTLAADFAGSGSAQKAARSDHTHDARYQRLYKRTVIVSPQGDGGNATANGTALRTALNGITGASETNPYLLLIEPGIYDVGGAPLQMREYVDIAGSGRGATIVRGSGSNTAPGATVLGADHAELRQLTVEADGRNTVKVATAIYNESVAPTLTDIDVSAKAATQFAAGIHNKGSLAALDRVAIHVTIAAVGSGASDAAGLYIEGCPCGAMSDVTILSEGGNTNRGVLIIDADPTLHDFQITIGNAVNSQGIAIINSDSYNAGAGAGKEATVENSHIEAKGTGLVISKASVSLFNCSIAAGDTGISATAGGSGEGILIDHCTVQGGTNSLHGASGYNFKIGGSKLVGSRDILDATAKCQFTYNMIYDLIGLTCQ